MQIDMTDAEWYAGLTLLERHAVLPAPLADDPGESQNSAIAGRTAEMQYRWRRWRHDGALNQHMLFARRLAADGLNEDRLRQVVHTPADVVRRACSRPPGWLQTLTDAVNNAPTQYVPANVRQACSGLLSLVEPLVAKAYKAFRTRVRDVLRHSRNVPFTQQAIDR